MNKTINFNPNQKKEAKSMLSQTQVMVLIECISKVVHQEIQINDPNNVCQEMIHDLSCLSLYADLIASGPDFAEDCTQLEDSFRRGYGITKEMDEMSREELKESIWWRMEQRFRGE